MKPIRTLRLDLSKIPASAEYAGRNGARYVTLSMLERRDGVDEYGWEGFASIDVSKEQREAGERGPIVGNWKDRGGPAPAAPARQDSRQGAPAPKSDYPRAPRPSQPPAPKPADPDLEAAEDDDIPF